MEVPTIQNGQLTAEGLVRDKSNEIIGIELYPLTPPVCRFHGHSHPILVPLSGLRAWNQGAYIQDAFGGMPSERRELIKSGICPEGWDALMGPEDEG